MSGVSLLGLRNVNPENIIEQYADTTAGLFQHAALLDKPDIVVIPACNEQRDLPATLLSLSRSARPVVPIVVENGSTPKDKTFEYAERMGAIALQCAPAKMRATQMGLQYAREHFPEQKTINFGDADNLYPRICVSAISRAVQKAGKQNAGDGSLLFGLGIYDHGTSAVVDLMRSGRIIRKALSRKLQNRLPMPYGFNYAIEVDADDKITEAVAELDPKLFVREESEICKAVTSVGGTIGQLISPSAVVFTRGDLIRTREEWREFKGASMDTKTNYYKRNYPGVEFQPNNEGREKSH